MGGEVLWKPIDRQAAMVIAKAPWWAKPPEISQNTVSNTPKNPKKDKPKKAMKTLSVDVTGAEPVNQMPNQDYVSTSGVRIKMVNGEPMYNAEDVERFMVEQTTKAVKYAVSKEYPLLKTAEESKEALSILLRGFKEDLERFKFDTKMYLDDIRQTRFAVVSETAKMSQELKDIRQFFMASDYKEQVTRLREFVEICERLQKLKDSGFLDRVADTMLNLAVS